MSNYIILVYGIVQNVGFRHAVSVMANKLKIRGYVRNLPNKIVEIYFISTVESLNEFKEFLKSSPGYSKVSRIVLKSVENNKKFDSFRILY